jgi:DNA polymerase-3 subunit gamma/tau
MRVLARTWQMLLKGIAEVEAAGRPIAAAEMVLVRIAYAADLPTPDEVIRSLGDGARGNGSSPTPPSPVSGGGAPASRADMPPRSELPRGGSRGSLASAAPMNEPMSHGAEAPAAVRAFETFEDVVALAAEKRDVATKSALERDVRLVRFEDGKLEIALEPSAAKTLVGDLSKKLAEWTGRRWMIAVSAENGAPPLRAQAEMRKAELKNDVRSDPLVRAVLTRFPGAEIVEVRPPATAPAATPDDMPPDNESDADA